MRQGGELVDYDSKLALFFRDTVKIPQIIKSFHDIRMHPRIRLKDILLSVFRMPCWGLTALLRLDFHLRTPKMLRLFRCAPNKKVVVSYLKALRLVKDFLHHFLLTKGKAYSIRFAHSSWTGFAGLISSPSSSGMMMSRKDVAIRYRASKSS